MPNLIKNKLILDLSRIIVGPYASSVLSGFGCEVIKVQAPQGDATRLWGPPWHNNTSTYFQSVNCNKRSITLNLKKQQSRQALYRLVQKSDVVLQNFIPGVTERLKIDFDTLTKYKKDLVYCSVSGYGEGTYKQRQPAFDNIIQAQSGFMHLTGSSQSPFKLGFAISDVLTGLYASNAILAGLLYRDQTKKSIHLKTSLYECSIASLINQASNHLNGQTNPQRLGNHHPNIVPYGMYMSKDGAIVICVGNQKQYQGLIRAISKIEGNIVLQNFEHFATNQLRVKHRLEFDKYLNDMTMKFTSQELIERLQVQKVPCGQVKDLKSVFSSQLTKQLGMVVEAGQTKTIRSPIRTNLPDEPKFQSSIKPPPYSNGQHTEEILKQIVGLSQRQVDQIRKENQQDI